MWKPNYANETQQCQKENFAQWKNKMRKRSVGEWEKKNKQLQFDVDRKALLREMFLATHTQKKKCRKKYEEEKKNYRMK